MNWAEKAISGAPAVLVGVDGADAYLIDMQTNTLTAGNGVDGLAASFLANHVGPGTVCINAVGITANSFFQIDNIDSGVLGITQADTASMQTVNGGVTVNTTGTITFNCAFPT